MAIHSEIPIHVLAIAPYESMTVSLAHAAEYFPNIRLDAHTGDLEEGVDIVKRLDQDSYDVIVSRGGTADMIRAITDVPVVEIEVSVYDVLRTIKLSENYTDQFAVVGFPAVTENAHILCNLLRLEAPIETVYDAEGAAAALERLKEKDIHTVICDKVTHSFARAKGFNALLITSGENSIQQALQEAEAQGNTFRRTRNENLFLRNILSRDSRQCIIYDEAQKAVFSFPDEMNEELTAFIRRRIPGIKANNENLMYHQVGNTLYAITASIFSVHDQRYTLFWVQSGHISLHSRHPGIRSQDELECKQLFMNSFFSISGSLAPLRQQLASIAAAERAIMLVGEEGTGREQIARYLYLNSRFKSHPFVMIDGMQLGDRGWNYLLENHASPLSTSSTTIFFHHMEQVPPQHQHAIISLIEETGLARRLWLIFSCEEQEGQPLSDFIRQLSMKLGPLTLHLPTLRSRQDEIPALSSIYLSCLNEELGKQLSGFEPSAMDLLMRYDWPGNYSQFKHVLQELTVLSSGHYISTHDVADLLARERRMYRRSKRTQESFPFDGQTLDEITRSIIRQALSANGGNQSLTAKQLGISRTTLWRALNQEQKGMIEK